MIKAQRAVFGLKATYPTSNVDEFLSAYGDGTNAPNARLKDTYTGNDLRVRNSEEVDKHQSASSIQNAMKVDHTVKRSWLQYKICLNIPSKYYSHKADLYAYFYDGDSANPTMRKITSTNDDSEFSINMPVEADTTELDEAGVAANATFFGDADAATGYGAKPNRKRYVRKLDTTDFEIIKFVLTMDNDFNVNYLNNNEEITLKSLETVYLPAEHDDDFLSTPAIVANIPSNTT
jgi:hypothetical protein